MSNLYQDVLNTKNAKDNALIFMGQQMSRADLLTNIDNMAGFLMSIGVKKGDVVGIIAPNTVTSIVAFYAINKIGAVSNIFHPLTAVNNLSTKLLQTNTKCIFVYDLFYKKYKAMLKKLGVKVIICSAKDYMPKIVKWIFGLGLDLVRGKVKNELTEKDFNRHFDSEIVDNEDCCYLHSSGSEKEKTALLTNDNFINLKEKMIDVIGKQNLAKERALVSLPMFHCFGLAVSIHSFLAMGFDLVVMPTFNAKKMVKLVKKHKVTLLTVIPSMLRKFINCGFSANFGSVKHIYCGGDTLDKKLLDNFNNELGKNNNIKVLQGYGLTELTGVCIVNTERQNKDGSIGKAVTGVKTLVVDDNNNIVKTGEKGELLLSSNTIMKGYLNEEIDLTKYDGEYYFKTGDIVYKDSDDFIYFVSRKKNIIKIGGFNVYPKDIEDLVLTIDGVKSAVCVKKDIEGKPYIYLFLVGNNTDKLKEQIYDKINKNMIKYCLPKEIIFVDKIPLTNNGKIDVNKLKNYQ